MFQAFKVIVTTLDEHQGNPAHVYRYGGNVFIANDKKNGFTHINPGLLGKSGSSPDRFYQAGGGHITLAAVQGQVAYSTWIDREGENKGRVDVVGLRSNADRSYHFHLSVGGIHGATANSGRVFFAPSDGICWLDADLSLSGDENSVDVHHLSLGESDEGVPHRTGAFENIGNNVLFTVGRSSSPQLCMLNASDAKPSVQKIAITTQAGNSLTTPVGVTSRTGSQYALLFEESVSGEQTELLHVVSLDPNLDGDAADAKVVKSVEVGRSLIEGHSGHHQVIPLSRQYVAVSNPGDGTITVISTSTWETQVTLKVGGNPGRMVAFGG